MAKMTIKEQLVAANNTINHIFNDMNNILGQDKIYTFILDGLEESLESLDEEIGGEQNFSEENPPGSTYSGAGNEARKQVRYLNKARLEQVKLIKMFSLFIKQRDKVKKMWAE